MNHVKHAVKVKKINCDIFFWRPWNFSGAAFFVIPSEKCKFFELFPKKNVSFCLVFPDKSVSLQQIYLTNEKVRVISIGATDVLLLHQKAATKPSHSNPTTT